MVGVGGAVGHREAGQRNPGDLALLVVRIADAAGQAQPVGDVEIDLAEQAVALQREEIDLAVVERRRQEDVREVDVAGRALAERGRRAEDAGRIIEAERGDIIVRVGELVVEVDAADQEVERPFEVAVEMGLDRILARMALRAVIIGAARGAAIDEAAVDAGVVEIGLGRADGAAGADQGARLAWV